MPLGPGLGGVELTSCLFDVFAFGGVTCLLMASSAAEGDAMEVVD